MCTFAPILWPYASYRNIKNTHIMKKILFLIPAMLLTLAINAAEIEVAPGTNTIRTAVGSASANDVLVLSTGTYTEEGNFDMKKNLTIKAADDTYPVIEQTYYFRVEGGAQVTFKGIKFNGTSDHCIRSYNNSTGEETITLEDCEFTGYSSYVIYVQRQNRRWDAITVRNCYFHNNTKSAIYIGKDNDDTEQSCNSLTIENSTFADLNATADYGVVYYDAPDAQHTTSLSVNHCTFYKHSKPAIQWNKSTDLAISNCIFALPSSVSTKSVECAGGTITNCLSYNSGGYSSDATPSGNLTGNPYFVNTEAGSYDFTPASFSPAHNAGTDSEDMGDYLRWTSNDSAHPTTKNLTAGDDAIRAAVEAAWPDDNIVLATGTYNESKRIALDKDITIKAASGATPTVVPVKDIAISNGADVTLQGIKFDCTSLDATRLIYAADNNATNNLTVESCEFCNTGSNIAIYAGGSARLNACVINNCYFHDGNNSAICIAGGSTYHVCDPIEITNSTFANYSGFAQALIQIASKGSALAADPADDQEIVVDHCTFYNFTKTSDNTYGFIDSRKSTNVTISNCIFANPTAQASLPSGTYNPKATQLYGGTVTNCLIYNVLNHRTDDVTPVNPIEANPLFADAENGDFSLKGNYITGEISPARDAATDGSDLGDPRWETDYIYPTTDFAKPYAFKAASAALSGNIKLETRGPKTPYLRYYQESTPGDATWKIQVTRPCYVRATVYMADNTWKDSTTFQNHNHIFAVEIKSGNSSIGSVAEGVQTEDGYNTYPTVPLVGSIYIPSAGVYTIILSNTRHHSRCGVDSVVLQYTGGLTIEVPGLLKAQDAVLVPKKMDYDENGYIHYGDYGTVPTDEYAYWKITTSGAFSGKVILDIPQENASNHEFHIELYEDLEGSKLSEAYEEVKESGHPDKGLIELEQTFSISEAGTYYVKLVNKTQWSSSILRSISIAPNLASTIDEEESSAATVIGANDGNTVNVQLERSFTAGMYNTICLPFDVCEYEMARVFPGAKVQELTSSSIEDGGFVLNLEFTEVNTLEAGKPYLIWPAANVTNPKFLAVTIDKDLHNSETTNADFVGNFVKGTIEESVDNLFLGADNMLYFPTTNVTIKGMRAYFQVKNPSGPSLIRSARIVTNEEETTDIDIVTLDNETSGTAVRKVLQDGQLYIIRDNAIFNVQGQRIK